MAETVRRVEYYYVTVPDTPAEGQRILSALKDSGVNLLAFLGFPLGGGQSQIDLVPEDPASLKEAAARAGVTLTNTSVTPNDVASIPGTFSSGTLFP
jgi:hypothetical protein